MHGPPNARHTMAEGHYFYRERTTKAGIDHTLICGTIIQDAGAGA